MKFSASAQVLSLWSYRGFVLGSVKREFQAKYRASMLGAAWTVLNPLSMILIYTLIFSQLMRARIPGIDSAFGYSIYLCAGILTWGLFAEIVSRTAGVFIENANLLKKLSFPRICLPVVVVLGALVNFAIAFGLFLLFLLVTAQLPVWPLLGLIPLLMVQIIFSVGLGMVAGVLNVFFRDVGQALGILLQFWFWLTPIVYPAAIVPDWARRIIFDVNPMAPVIGGYQGIFVTGAWPDWSALAKPLLLGFLLCALGLYLFRRHADEMVDEL
ncbi:Teichoic acid translocation permease protein TagG [Thiorhodovibrio winogradskyi]|uniref:Transport permease protein n=1 Tax=Thiorhodovibrio winogradskyi TaxID=77007 RepID=A0ABZ0S5Y2_9GAMM|nr:ABC transporter permease [Thiorhodovibrio winogradskyi]